MSSVSAYQALGKPNAVVIESPGHRWKTLLTPVRGIQRSTARNCSRVGGAGSAGIGPRRSIAARARVSNSGSSSASAGSNNSDFMARGRALLRVRAPDVLRSLLDAGAIEFALAPFMPGDRPNAEDDELVVIFCRRPLFESALWRAVASIGAGLASLSTTTTSCPSRASTSPANNPVVPAPTTVTRAMDSPYAKILDLELALRDQDCTGERQGERVTLDQHRRVYQRILLPERTNLFEEK
jgi:hypothetical protein